MVLGVGTLLGWASRGSTGPLARPQPRGQEARSRNFRGGSRSGRGRADAGRNWCSSSSSRGRSVSNMAGLWRRPHRHIKAQVQSGNRTAHFSRISRRGRSSTQRVVSRDSSAGSGGFWSRGARLPICMATGTLVTTLAVSTTKVRLTVSIKCPQNVIEYEG